MKVLSTLRIPSISCEKNSCGKLKTAKEEFPEQLNRERIVADNNRCKKKQMSQKRLENNILEKQISQKIRILPEKRQEPGS